MRVHSWSEFALGAAGFSVGIALLLRGNGVDGLFGVGWIAIGAVHPWRAFNKAWCARTKEQEEKQRRAARQAAGEMGLARAAFWRGAGGFGRAFHAPAAKAAHVAGAGFRAGGAGVYDGC